MKTFIAIALAGAASALTEMEFAFMQYITEFDKDYPTLEEFNHRLAQFTRAHEVITEHNASEATFKLGHNQMSDWTREEYLSLLTHEAMPEEDMNIVELTDDYEPIDWRAEGKVNAIKDQGQCGSCWAFSSVAALETTHAIASNHLYSLSEQQLVDCVPHCHGCNGGLQSYAFNYYHKNAAIEEKEYAYTAKDGTCSTEGKPDTGVKVENYVNVASKNPTQMKSALMKTILSVSIEADKEVFQYYKSGIFNSEECGTRLDHATDVVGWGSEAGIEYWIMRNSWSKRWGEAGYMRLQITDGKGKGVCGIQSSPLYPNVPAPSV